MKCAVYNIDDPGGYKTFKKRSLNAQECRLRGYIVSLFMSFLVLSRLVYS